MVLTCLLAYLLSSGPFVLEITCLRGRIEEPDYPLPQGAFRQGKYKLLRNVWCTGYYSFDPIVNEQVSCRGGNGHFDFSLTLSAV